MRVAETLLRFLETGPWGAGFERMTSTPEPPRCLFVHQDGSSAQLLLSRLPPCPQGHKRIVSISDTHGKHRLVQCPAADVLVHCGDILSRNACALKNNGRNHKKGRVALRDFNDWLGEQSQCRSKVVIGGNHDATLEEIGDERAQQLLSNATYLHDSAGEVEGLRIYGSPWSSGKSANRAFQANTPVGLLGKMHAARIDILVCHSYNEALMGAVAPSLFLSGHSHGMFGVLHDSPCIAVNSSICDTVYRTANFPVVHDMKARCIGVHAD